MALPPPDPPPRKKKPRLKAGATGEPRLPGGEKDFYGSGGDPGALPPKIGGYNVDKAPPGSAWNTNQWTTPKGKRGRRKPPYQPPTGLNSRKV